MASEQEKLLPLAFHVSVAAHRFQNDAVKKGWEGREIRDVRQERLFLREARWHKQCAERVCSIVVVVVFGWGANEWNEEDDECHRWPS